MRASKTKNGLKFDTETTVVSEDVVLGTNERNTPASLVVDEDGLLDIEKISDEDSVGEPESETEPEKETEVKPRVGVVSWVLALLRRPENLLIQWYYDSAIRNKLLNRFDWYKDFECEAQLTNNLGNLYGTNRPLSHFVKNNILVSLIIIAVSGQMFVNYLSRPVENRYANNEAPVEAVVATKLEPDYSNILNHCAVTDNLRGSYGNTDNGNVKNEVIAEVEGFIKVYNSSNIEQWHADQESKRGIVISQVQSILPRIHRYREQISADIYDINQQHAQLEARLDAITTAGSQDLGDINKSIKLRNELTEMETAMTVGPNPDTLDDLDAQLKRLEQVIAGDESLARPVSNWARDTSEQSQAILIDSVRDVIDKDIDTNIVQIDQGSAEIKQYRMRTLTATLSHFGDLIGQLQNTPNYFEVNVGDRQSAINDRLRALFGQQEQPKLELLNYDNCLTALNTTQTKLTAH